MENLLSEKELKAFIREKFGSASRFCKITGRDVYQFNKLFVLKDSEQKQAKLQKIQQDAEELENKLIEGELTEKLKKDIKTGIFTVADNILDFSQKHGFSNTWVSNVINGKVKKITSKIRELAKAAKVEI